jgi:hypothetical protein
MELRALQTPESDHASLWRIPSAPSFRSLSAYAEVLVTQPFMSPSSFMVDKMEAFAAKRDLCFWISTWPAWHFPGHALFVEWASMKSIFYKIRSEQERSGERVSLVVYPR